MSAASIFTDPAESSPPDATALGWLESRGVASEDIASPFPVHVARVIFDANRYEPSAVGDFAFILAVFDEELIDAAAWEPATGRVATRLGIGALLGQSLVGRAGWGTTGRALPVWRSPLEWLHAGRRGLVVIDVELAAHVLAGHALKAEDHAHCRNLKRILRVPPPAFVDLAQQDLAA